MGIDKTQFKADLAEFKKHIKARDLFGKAMGGLCDTPIDDMIDHLARALDRIHGGRKFMDLACK